MDISVSHVRTDDNRCARRPVDHLSECGPERHCSRAYKVRCTCGRKLITAQTEDIQKFLVKHKDEFRGDFNLVREPATAK